ncbi:MAG: acyltransferase [Pseudomonadota bacterium]
MPQLDALRGIAALVVVVSHSANAGFLPAFLGAGFGQMGVGLFYVLSAFLLTTIYIHKEPNGPVVRDYLVRRVCRVLPLFYAALFASLILEATTGVVIFGAFDSPEVTLKNVLLIHGTSVLWSIPAEIHFYLLFIVFWVLMRKDVKLAFLALVFLQTLLLAAAVTLDFSVYSLPYWMHFFTFGCFLAVVFDKKTSSLGTLSAPLPRVFFFLLIAATPILLPAVRSNILGFGMPIFLDPIALIWVGGLSTAFIFLTIPKHYLDNSFFRVLGELSFGVYLIHMAVISLASASFLGNVASKNFGFLVIIVLSYSLAAIANRYFERPVQDWLLKSMSVREKRSA